MKQTSISKAWLAIAFSTLLLFSACSKKETPVEVGNKNQILHMGNGAEPKDLDPHIITGVPEHYLMAALFEGLVSENPRDLSPEPAVAQSWKVSKNGKTYTFKIRKNAKWHNGDPVTAHDFTYAWSRILAPKLGSEYAYMLYVLKNAEKYHKSKIKNFSQVGVKAIDDHTLQVELAHSTPYFLGLLTHYSTFPVHKATIEKFGKKDEQGTKWTRPGNLVGNGPFKLKTWELNKVIQVVKADTYWDAAQVKLREIHYHPIESSEVEERAFRAGQLHITNTIPPEKIAVWRKKNPENLHIDPYLGTYYYRFNVTRKPFNNPKVRQALTMAIDRKAITQYVTKAGEIPTYSFTPPDTGGYTPRAKTGFDIEKAKKLLAEAGYPNGNGFPKAEILYNTLEAHQSIAEAIQQMWKKNLNIHVSLANQDWKVYLSSQKNLQYWISRGGLDWGLCGSQYLPRYVGHRRRQQPNGMVQQKI